MGGLDIRVLPRDGRKGDVSSNGIFRRFVRNIVVSATIISPLDLEVK